MSCDDSMVLTAAYDKSARVWDLASGKCLAVLASSAQVRPFLGTSCLCSTRSHALTVVAVAA